METYKVIIIVLGLYGFLLTLYLFFNGNNTNDTPKEKPKKITIPEQIVIVENSGYSEPEINKLFEKIMEHHCYNPYVSFNGYDSLCNAINEISKTAYEMISKLKK